jgi:hypothetical protein
VVKGCGLISHDNSPDSQLSQLFTMYSNADHGGNPDSGKSKLTYKIFHMFRTFGKMALLLKYLHSHNYGEYVRL